MQVIWTDCQHCGTTFTQPDDPGRKRQFCSNACRQAAYRRRRKRAEQAEQQRREQARQRQREEQRSANDDAWRRARDRYQRQQRRHQPPPHAGTSRPGTWCGACGGTRGPHSLHHDDAAHERARRRYEALRRKAASTTFPEEADACQAKAEQLRAKYGL